MSKSVLSDPDPRTAPAYARHILPSGEPIIVLFDTETIAARVRELAEAIVAGLGPDFVVVALLKGGLVFTADLLRALHHAGATPEVDILTLSSYGAGTRSTGQVQVKGDAVGNLAGRTALIVDDILESGRSLSTAREWVMARGARTAATCVLLEKPGKRALPIEADFRGFAAPDIFVVGYGMDLAHRFRELPFIGALPDERPHPETL